MIILIKVSNSKFMKKLNHEGFHFPEFTIIIIISFSLLCLNLLRALGVVFGLIVLCLIITTFTFLLFYYKNKKEDQNGIRAKMHHIGGIFLNFFPTLLSFYKLKIKIKQKISSYLLRANFTMF